MKGEGGEGREGGGEGNGKGGEDGDEGVGMAAPLLGPPDGPARGLGGKGLGGVEGARKEPSPHDWVVVSLRLFFWVPSEAGVTGGGGSSGIIHNVGPSVPPSLQLFLCGPRSLLPAVALAQRSSTQAGDNAGPAAGVNAGAAGSEGGEVAAATSAGSAPRARGGAPAVSVADLPLSDQLRCTPSWGGEGCEAVGGGEDAMEGNADGVGVDEQEEEEALRAGHAGGRAAQVRGVRGPLRLDPCRICVEQVLVRAMEGRAAAQLTALRRELRCCPALAAPHPSSPPSPSHLPSLLLSKRPPAGSDEGLPQYAADKCTYLSEEEEGAEECGLRLWVRAFDRTFVSISTDVR